MERERIIDHLVILGKVFKAISSEKDWPGYEIGISENEYNDIKLLVEEALKLNGWFTQDQVHNSMDSWADELTEPKLNSWLSDYAYVTKGTKKVGVIMAGNIPMVGLHDLISVLLSGHSIIIRPSSDDHVLIRMIAAILNSLDDEYNKRILWADGKMKGHEAVIATGSNNTSRYFEQYFSEIPHIIRKNRNGVAILSGDESEAELTALGKDIFQYFGLGCRNVSKLYIPESYNLDEFFKGIYPYKEVIEHNKYANNYDYYRSVFLLNDDNILDNGFLLVKEHEALASPMASIHYETYSDRERLVKELFDRKDEIQCIISRGHLAFGSSQHPSLADYADGVDTMRFLTEL